MQSVPNSTKVVSLNPVHGEVYSIQHYVIKFVSDLLWFSPVTPSNKTDRHDITEILLKMASNTINFNHKPSITWYNQIKLTGSSASNPNSNPNSSNSSNAEKQKLKFYPFTFSKSLNYLAFYSRIHRIREFSFLISDSGHLLKFQNR
jgi:hypothetical protein